MIDRILRAIFEGLSDLEDVERALRQAEPTSTRARHAREQLLHALSKTDDLIEGVSNAEGALIFNWNRTAAPAPR
ncbi:MAG: hypothetical protein ACT4NY_29475 [Pseudonocardiales bacterium]